MTARLRDRRAAPVARGAVLRTGTVRRAVCKADDLVDAFRDSVFPILLTHTMTDARTITPSLEPFPVSRTLERVADLATNIGADVLYLAEDKQVEHRIDECGGRAAPALAAASRAKL